MVRGVPVRARLAGVLAVVGLAIVAAACSGPGVADQSSGAERAANAKQATKELAQAEKQDLGCNNIVTSRDKRVTPPPKDMVLLVDAYVAPEACWDKVTFTFEPTGANVPPGYTIEYRDPPFVEGDEGQYPVETLGDAFLYLTFAPASQTDYNNSGSGVQTYKGPIRLLFQDTHHIRIVRKLIDGDGAESWIIGLDQKQPFTVDAVADSANHESRVSVYIMK